MELFASGGSISALRIVDAARAESSELNRELQETRNALRDCRNNYAVLQHQESARQARQMRHHPYAAPERKELIREPRSNWVLGCEKYGIGVDEPG